MVASASFDVPLAREIIARRRSTPGAALPILHDLQHHFGYIDDAAIPLIADALNISRAETLGVVSFYPDFRRAPVEGRVLKLCRAESCQAMGCESLVAHLKTRHGIAPDAPSRAGLSVETVYCLGNCALSPAALLDGAPVGRLDPDRLDAIVASAKEFGEVTSRAFVPADSSALSVGADAVAAALTAEARRRGVDLAVVRTGSRGLFWLEPLVEIEGADGRIGYGPIAPEDAASLFDSDFLAGGAHPKALGRVEDIPFLARQQRLVFARCGVTDPLSLDDYRAHGGLRGSSARSNSIPTRSSTRSSHPASEAAAAPASPPASSGERSATRRRIRSTSSATPTRETAEPSPTGC